MASLNEIAIKILVDGKELDATIKGLNKDIESVNTSGEKAGGGIASSFGKMKVGILAVAGVIAGVGAGLNKVVNIASDFQEANSKFNVVFSGMEKQARAMREELVKSYAMSTTEATRHLAAVQDLLVPMGMNRKAAANLSGEIVKLSADLGSFNNLPTEQVMMDVQSALVGNFETMKKYGVVLNETTVKQKAINLGLYNGKGVIDAAARSQAAYQLIVEGSTAAIGDMARTSDSYANTKKKVAAATEDLSLKLGAVFLPIWNKVLNAVLKFINYLGSKNIGGILFATWEVIAEFGTRIWNWITNIGTLLEGLLTFDRKKIAEGAQGLWDTLTGGWSETVTNIVNAYDEGNRAFDEFIEGETQTYIASQEKIHDEMEQTTAKEAEELEKRNLQSKQAHWKYLDQIKEKIRIYKKERADEAAADAARYKQQIEFDKKERIRLANNAVNNLRIIAQQFKGFGGIWKVAAKAQALVDAYAAANAAYKSMAGVPLVGPFLGASAAAVALAAGLANVARINAVKFGRGGLADRPMFGLVGELGEEIMAPKSDYVEVHNKMIQSGEIGGGSNTELLNEISAMREDISNLQLRVGIDNDEMAVFLEGGNKKLTLRTY